MSRNKLKKYLSILLTLCMVLAAIPAATMPVFADEGKPVSTSVEGFADMPQNWSTAALTKAVENDLLSGYQEGGKKLIKAANTLTRAEMAAVVNRAFASVKQADISKVSDVATSAWYAKDMAKAVKMGTFAYDTKMRPNDKISRQEAFTVLARAFKLVGTDSNHKTLNGFSDKKDIASWALDSLDGMVAAGYVQGSGGKLNPKANITRAEFAVVMDNLVKEYIDSGNTVNKLVAEGNVMVRKAGTTLKGVTVKGDLIIADGVGEGDVILDDVKVKGRTLVRGGGVNSLIIKGDSDLGKVIVAKVDGKVRVGVEGNAKVEIIYIDDGSDDIFIEGKIGTLEVTGDKITVKTTKAEIKEGIVSGDNSKILVGTGSKISNISIKGKSSTISVEENASVDQVTVTGPGATIEGKGQVENVEVKAGGNNASINTPNTVVKVDQAVQGTSAGGTAVPGGSTATNNATGTGATVTQPGTGGSGSGSSNKVAVSAISITTPPAKTIYEIGDPIDLAGLVVTATYSDNSSKVVAITSGMINGFDSSAVEVDQVVTVTYEGKTATFKVTIKEAIIVDTIPPVISGVSDKNVLKDSTVDVLAGVTAMDDVDGIVAVTANPSTIDTNTVGTTEVTYTATDVAGNTATATATFTVVETAVDVTGVSLDKATLDLIVGDTPVTLVATIAPNDATNQKVTWISSDTGVATVVDGIVTPVAAGSTTITVTTQDGSFTATCGVTVTDATVAVTGVSLDQSTMSLTVGGATGTLTATVAPANSDNKKVTWSSSAEGVATVDANGKVTAVSAGNANITVTTEDGGKTATCAVTATEAPITVSDISISGDAVVGQMLTAEPTPAAATGTYQWMRSATADGTYTDIPSATSKTYTLDAADFDKYIKVKITANGSYTGTKESVATSQVTNGTPAASDFDIANLTQTVGGVTPVTVTPQAGKSSGAVTIYYEGTGGTTYTKSTTLPSDAGSYAVTFDVAAATGWNAATGLAGGTLIINAANQDPLAGDYTIANLTQTVGSVTAVTITPQAGKSSGAVTIYYEGTGGTTYTKSTTLPSDAGSYAVTFDVAATTGWNAATGLAAGTLTINAAVLPAMTGAVVITGAAKYDEILEADITGLTNAGANPTYQWKRGSSDITGATNKTYKLVEDDIGQTITVTVTAEVTAGAGSITSSPTAPVDKAQYPRDPHNVIVREDEVTATTIIVRPFNMHIAPELQEISIDDGQTWHECTGESITLTGLTPNNLYKIIARGRETETHHASKKSGSISIWTKEVTKNRLSFGVIEGSGEFTATVDGQPFTSLGDVYEGSKVVITFTPDNDGEGIISHSLVGIEEKDIIETIPGKEFTFTMPEADVQFSVNVGSLDRYIKVDGEEVALINGVLSSDENSNLNKLSWNFFTRTLTMDGFTGNSINWDGNSHNVSKIRVKGENTLNINSGSIALYFAKIAIVGQGQSDKLTINSDSRYAINLTNSLTLDNVSLKISHAYKGINEYSGAIGAGVEIINGGNLEIITENTRTAYKASGISGDLTIEDGSAEIQVKSNEGIAVPSGGMPYIGNWASGSRKFQDGVWYGKIDKITKENGTQSNPILISYKVTPEIANISTYEDLTTGGGSVSLIALASDGWKLYNSENFSGPVLVGSDKGMPMFSDVNNGIFTAIKGDKHYKIIISKEELPKP